MLLVIYFLLTIKITDNKSEEVSYVTQITNKEVIINKSYKDEIKELIEKYNNKDIKGILEIDNKKFPLVQTSNNDYYLNHLPNKKKNKMGSVFLDYRVNIDKSNKLLIYGHNSSKYNMPFKILENYYNKDYLNKHKTILLKTKNKIKKYELFSIYVETNDFSYMDIKYNKKDYLKHLKDLQNKSIYKINTNIDENTNILILQTCSTHKNYKKYKKKYLLLSFREI